MFSKLITLFALVGFASAKQLYDNQRSDVSIYTPINFEK